MKLARISGKITAETEQKVRDLSRLAIIGGGIVGKSLLFALAKEKRQKYDSVTLYESDALAPACTQRSTAIVAARGVLPGLSTLGDNIHQGISFFCQHVESDYPSGVYPVKQVSSALLKQDAFFRRYQSYIRDSHFQELNFSQEIPLFVEDAYYVKPDEYCQWLLGESQKKIKVKVINEFVTAIDQQGLVKTLNGESAQFDHIILACGVNNQIWSGLVDEPKLKKTKSVRGSYLLFQNVSLFDASYSLSIDDLNFIYRRESQELLIGPTSKEGRLYEFNEKRELTKIYDYFQNLLVLKLPDISYAQVQTGMREKAPKREPYSGIDGRISYLGGLYKNGFTLSLKMATDVVHQLP